MRMLDDFAILILTHGRVDRVITYDALRKCGYTGRIILVVDDEDESLEEYKLKYPGEVEVFSKRDLDGSFDIGDNFTDYRVVVYARNYCFELAKSLGLKYFMELDDDYTTFLYKFNEGGEYQERRILSFDKILEGLLEFYKSVPALSVAMAQNGDYIGGGAGSFGRKIGLRRKCMNTFICSVDRPFKFIGRINEDINTYMRWGWSGELFFTVSQLSLKQGTTQANDKGLTDFYLDTGTYVKSFYSVMYMPSAVKVTEMGDKHMRLHHNVMWRYAVPLILEEGLKKV